jgi:hypothetical protein
MSNWQTPITTWGQPGQTVPGADDFNRIEGNIDILGKYDRAPGYGTAIGTNAKTITLDPAPESYYEGLCFAFKNATQNTGAVTINVNGMGAKAIKKPNGNDLVSGNLKAGSVYTVRYNGTNFILQGEGGDEEFYRQLYPDGTLQQTKNFDTGLSWDSGEVTFTINCGTKCPALVKYTERGSQHNINDGQWKTYFNIIRIPIFKPALKVTLAGIVYDVNPKLITGTEDLTVYTGGIYIRKEGNEYFVDFVCKLNQTYFEYISATVYFVKLES